LKSEGCIPHEVATVITGQSRMLVRCKQALGSIRMAKRN
jgi:hypothetical protein